MKKFKPLFLSLLATALLPLGACSTNPATGKQQFAALMSPSQENEVGASEHQKIVQQFGLVEDKALNNYVTSIGNKVTANTERPEVKYKFFIIDSPIVNAFALPGGYIYVSRGLLALAGSEAELASVLGHEAGHITGRHSAERYSRGVVTTLGAGILSAAIGSEGASQALGVGANLFMSSYSRDQENEADTLGLRYMTRGGYAPEAVPSFLYSLQRQSQLEASLNGQSGQGFSYFSTHPATSDRVSKTKAEAGVYPQGGNHSRDTHLNAINGMTYGDSAKQGFARGTDFYHPAMGFTFSVPQGFKITNQPSQVVATNNAGSVVIFDMVANKQGLSPSQFIGNVWLKEAKLQGLENITVNGLPAATASLPGTVGGKAVTIRVVAISWQGKLVRFQMAIPNSASSALVEQLKKTTYSFRMMSASEKKSVHPYKLRLYTAKANDTVASISRRMPFDTMQEERFRILNAIGPGQDVAPGARYKIVSEN